MKNIILASASNARRKILDDLGITYTAIPSNIDESKIQDPDPKKLVQLLSNAKATEVAKSRKGIVIGADSLIFFNRRIIGKPSSIEEAESLLREFSGNSQILYTGVTILDTSSGKTKTFAEETKIYFRKITEDEILAYAKDSSILNHAGGYNIAGKAMKFIRSIEGDYFNFVGLPICRIAEELKEFDINL